jgi:hypothetical protein
MFNNIHIEIPNDSKFSHEIRNELTEFIDKYRIYKNIPKDEYKDLFTTYIHIDNTDVYDLLHNKNDISILAFRIPGATRGGIYIRQINRTDTDIDINIECEIMKVSFCEDTCFKIFKTYSRKVVDATNNMVLGTKILLTIKK